MKSKKIFLIIFLLVGLQLLRIGLIHVAFLFFEKNTLNITIFNLIYMALITIIFFIICWNKKIILNIFPKRFNKKYIIISIFVFLLLILTPVITQNFTLSNIISLIYNVIVTVIFEEILFRGFVYENISNIDKYKYIYSSILFGIWHLGYIDTIIYRTSIFFPNADILNIMFWKVITGLILGFIFGYFRYKNKNVYSSILVHTFINIIGS